MKLLLQPPKKSISKTFLKQRPHRSEMNLFKAELINLLDRIDSAETEEFHKNLVSDFLKKAIYPNNFINTKGRQDLVIHNGKDNKTSVGVIIETKRPSNKSEWFSADKPNGKAIHELVLYYLRERIEYNNTDLKYVIATNINEWYIFEAKHFEKLFNENRQLVNNYKEWRDGKKVTKDTSLFYNEIVKPHIDSLDDEISCTYFNIQDYLKVLKNVNKADDKNLIALLKVLSPQHLLKVSFTNDSNELDQNFYKELLHIIGLEEAKENGKNIIRRKKENKNTASFLEMAIKKLKTKGLHKITDIKAFGETTDEQYFNIALELCITWINRVLFLKLLEGQLLSYHKGDKSYRFLNTEMIHDFDELFKLFHSVLAVNIQDRDEEVAEQYKLVPYLNSSLFEISDLEDLTISIDSLDNSESFDLLPSTILKETKKRGIKPKTLEYLFTFLGAYDFASEGSEDIQEDNKPLINASVLGKVFERINGYKDGSIFTPAFITMYICKQSIRLAVVQKFNEAKGWGVKTIDDVYNKIDDIGEANGIINSLKICDPAVGSGHFLVSALNEIIAIKSELHILQDKNGKRLKEYTIEVENDELYITDEDGDIFEYIPQNKESQRVQETLFLEKQNIIENCLFGVDINSNSVKICRLRLWIELLKNAYYKTETNYKQLETLPNIDINIKCGNSLLCRFALDADLSKALKSIKYDVKAYRDFVNHYKNEKNREAKRGLLHIINSIKNDFRTEISKNDPKVVKLNRLSGELYTLLNQTKLFDENAKEKKVRKEKQAKIESDIKKLTKEIEDIKTNAVYKNAFEWRFEFPEILDNNGDYEGFDVIIGNPPYIQLQKLGEPLKKALEQQQFETFTKTGDIYQLFYEQGFRILKEKGQLGFITSNKWMRTDYGTVTRNFLSSKCQVKLVVDFGMTQLFGAATTYTNILLFEKSPASQTIKICRIKDEYDQKTLLEDYIDFAALELENPKSKSWIAYDKREYSLIQKIIGQGKQLKDWDIQINRGILTGLNEAFIIDTKTRNELVAEDPKSAEIIKPILRGEDIKAYTPHWAGLWIIGTFPSLNLNINEYPAIEKYLSKFKEKLGPKPKGYDDKLGKWKGRKSGPYTWFETQDSISYYQDFLKPKIIYPNMTKFMPFVYDKSQFFTNQKCFIITGAFLAYLTAFFNSKIFRFAFKEYFPELLGDTRELSKVFFETVTIHSVDTEVDNEFDILLNQIIDLKSQGKSTLHIEHEIEEKLCKIYSLTESEISLIASSESVAGKAFPEMTATSELVNS